jgi:hypothetical protein
MDIDANALLVSLLVGLIGTALFVYGKRQGRVSSMVVGVALVIYPYFIPNAVLVIGIAAALIMALWGARRLGW